MLSIFNQNGGGRNSQSIRVETCQQACPPASNVVATSLPKAIKRGLDAEDFPIIAPFGPNGASQSSVRGVRVTSFQFTEFLSKWQTGAPDGQNDGAVVKETEAATVATADTWALAHNDHQRLFRDYATGSKIFRPIGQVFHIQVPSTVYKYQVGITDDNSSPLSAAVTDKLTFNFIEDQCRDIYLFVPRGYDPFGTNTVHTEEVNIAYAAFVNFASENDPNTASVTAYLAHRAFDVSGSQVAVTIPVNSWLLFPTENAIKAALGVDGAKFVFENQQISIL